MIAEKAVPSEKSYFDDFPRPLPYAGWVLNQAAPASWVIPMVSMIMTGIEGGEAINGIGFDVMGDLLLYRKVTKSDRERFPELEGIAEVWINLDQEYTD